MDTRRRAHEEERVHAHIHARDPPPLIAVHVAPSPGVDRTEPVPARRGVGRGWSGRRRAVERGIAIDLGSARSRLATPAGVVIDEPSVVARTAGGVVAVGGEAQAMLGRAHDRVQVVEPVADALIVDVEAAEHLLRALVHRAELGRSRSGSVIVSVPVLTTEVQRRALLGCVERVLPRRVVTPIEAPMAAAIGAGLPVQEPYGSMVVDVGRGTTEAAVLSLGDVVTARTAPLGGAAAEAAVAAHLRARYDLLVGQHRAERLVRLSSQPQCRTVVAQGRDRTSGLPRARRLSGDEVREVLAGVVDGIAEVTRGVLDATPHALAADVMQGGIILTGGASRLPGLAARITELTGMQTAIRPDPDRAVIDGARVCLSAARSRWS